MMAFRRTLVPGLAFSSVIAFVNSLAFAFAFAIPSPTAAADAFPSRPIRLICPFPPGGAVDVSSRAIASELSRQLGQPVVVENRPGAGGNIGGAEAVKAAPDGHTLFMTTSGISAVNPLLYRKMPFDPVRDLTPVSVLVAMTNVLVVNTQIPARTVADLLQLIRLHPGTMTFASSGTGTSIHMSGEMFKYMAGADIIHVPYKGSAAALTDLMGGQVSMMFDNLPSALPHIRAGRLRALATTGRERDPALPEVPTMAQAGVAGYESGVWFGLAAPGGTPPSVIAQLNAAAVKAARSQVFAQRMNELGYTVLATSPAQMAEMIGAEIRRWTPIVKTSGASAD
jgi:tripartite-type tricarboxylate transporter receptor subunit TctC